MSKKKYKVSNRKSMIIEANNPEEAEEIFLDSFNECLCEMVSVEEIKKRQAKV